MSLRSFLYAAQAQMKEEGLSFHVETPAGQIPPPPDTAARNTQAMSMLTGMMSGVSKKKGARR